MTIRSALSFRSVGHAAALFVFLLILMRPGDLLAQITVEVRNQTGGRVFVCFSYHDVISDSRITRGWWEVEPYAARDIRVNADQPELAWYAYSSRGRSWGGREGDADAERRHVVLENFLVKEGWKPRGQTHRMVYMKKVVTGGGRHAIVLSDREP